jgi:hypothetical protein
MRKLSVYLAGLLTGALAMTLGGPALADGATESETKTDPETDPKSDSIPEIIAYHRPGIDTTRNEIFIYAGPFYGDQLRVSYLLGADYIFFFSEIFGIGPTFQYAHASFPEVPAFEGSFQKTSAIHMTAMSINMSLPMAYRMGNTVIRGELRTALGGGAASINKKWNLYGFFGGGAKMYFGVPWLAGRVDIRGSLTGMETPLQGNELSSNLSILFGLSFQLPPTRQ